MATLTVWKFDSPGGADSASMALQGLTGEDLLVIHDAAVAEWEEGENKPRTRQLDELAGVGALGGGFWGLLFGLIFLIPLLGAAVGAATGALSGSLADVGIDERFIKGVRAQVTPGTSALFVLSSQAVLDEVRDAFADDRPDMMWANLSKAQEHALVEVFGV